MQQEIRNIQYFIYARKSSESDDRQVQSIDDQINRLEQLANDLNLEVKAVYTEAKSAKKPGNRPIFNEMMKRIECGDADGILCWQINRLSRNPIDSGLISWLLQQNILKSIQTIDRQYLPNDNVLLFSVESGSANQFILDLKKNVVRGMESKLQKGWIPGMAPLGYLNDRLEKTIINDPKRFDLVRKMWDLMLTGAYTPPKILEIATNEWGFKTRAWKKNGYGGNPVARSSIYKMFTNPFYTGVVNYFGKCYMGKHEAMITADEFNRVQMLLNKKSNPRPKHRKFAYTGVIRCAECGCLYTAIVKQKLLKNGQIKEYIYYYCTRRTRKVICSQRKVITEEKLEALIEKEISKYAILPQFLDWALEALNRRKQIENKSQIKQHEMQQATLTQTKKDMEELTKMRYRQLIDDETFLKERNELLKAISRLQNQLHAAKNGTNKWLDLTKDTFLFAAYAGNIFLKGGLELKKEILLGLGENIVIMDGKLFIKPYDWFVPIQKIYPLLEQEFRRLELAKHPENIGQNTTFVSICTRWYTVVEDIRKIFESLDNEAIYIPKLPEMKK